MKTKTLQSAIVLFLILGSFNTQAQVKVPHEVTSSFQLRYKTSEQVIWEVSNNQYVATFEHLSESKRAFYRKDGVWVKTMIELEPSRLMFCFRDHIKMTYPSYQIIRAFAIKNTEVLNYYAEIKALSQTKTVVFNKKCELVKVD